MLRSIIFIFISCLFYFAGIAKQENSSLIPCSNLKMIEKGVALIADSVFTNNRVSTLRAVLLTTETFEYNWIPKQAVSNILKEKGHPVYEDKIDSALSVRISSFKSNIIYGSQFRESLFSPSKTERQVQVQVGFSLTDNISKEILFNSLFQSTIKDTIFVNMISNVEDQSISLTIASLPAGNYLDRLVEPILILGATGAAVYLFYHVRTK
jgi:hypothetical protein